MEETGRNLLLFFTLWNQASWWLIIQVLRASLFLKYWWDPHSIFLCFWSSTLCCRCHSRRKVSNLAEWKLWDLRSEKGPHTCWSKTSTGSSYVFCGIHYSTSPGRSLCEQLFSCLLVIFISVELLSWPRATEFSWQHIWLSGLAAWAGEASGWQPRPLWQTFFSLSCNTGCPISPTQSVNFQLLS